MRVKTATAPAIASYESALGDAALADERIVVLTAENRAPIRGLPAVLGDRFVDVGIAEQTLIGMAAGLARRGRIPVVHALATFLTMRPFEFIRTDVGIAGLPVKLVGYVPGFLSEANGPTHQALEDVGLMRGIPGMKVFSPADREDLVLGLPAILAEPGPVYLRFCGREPVIRHEERFEVGRAELVLDGSDVAVLTHGTLFTEGFHACSVLRERGVSTGLLNLRTLVPLDEDAVLEALWSARLVVTLEDHFTRGGLATSLAELLMRHRLTARVLPLSLDTWFRPALLADVLAFEGFTPERIAQRILEELER